MADLVINTDDDPQLTTLIEAMTNRFGREPTENEVLNFIFGSEEERNAIWNSEVTNVSKSQHGPTH